MNTYTRRFLISVKKELYQILLNLRTMKTEILPAVAAIIFNRHNEVLLQKRKDTHKWCIISGHVEFGESLDQAILREVMEEINVAGKIVRLIGVYSSPHHMTYLYDDKRTQYVTAYFELQLEYDAVLHISNEETQELKYFSTDRLPEMDQIHPCWLDDALRRQEAAFIR